MGTCWPTPPRSYGVPMNRTQRQTTDVTDAEAKPRAPRQRATPGDRPPKGYAKARLLFEASAQRLLLSRPGRVMNLPEDLTKVIALGVPCLRCGASVYSWHGAGHRIEWKIATGKHWASGITASCGRAAAA